MQRPAKKVKRVGPSLRFWTLERARQAVPYLSSVTASLRNHWLEGTRQRLRAKRLAEAPGRADRERLLAHQEAVQAACRAEDAFETCLEELQAVDVFCLDPVRGLALVPFSHQGELAWFVFDLFTPPDHVQAWRFHRDSLDQRRPLDELAAPSLAEKVQS